MMPSDFSFKGKDLQGQPGQAEDFEMVKATFGPDTDSLVDTWLSNKLESLKNGHMNLHESLIPKWRQNYNGKPLSEKKSFPWDSASNTIVQVIGQTVDTIAARVLGFVFSTPPLAHFQYPALVQNSEEAEKKRRIIEQFIDIMGYEPSQLDLYRIYGQWFTDSAKLGTAFVKALFEDRVEALVVGYTSSRSNRKTKFEEKSLYYGPKVEKLRHEDVLMDAGAQTIEKSQLVAHKRTLSKMELEERAFNGFYDKTAVQSILGKPDRAGPDTNEQKEERDKGIHAQQGTVNAEWDVWECYFPWFHNGHKFRLIQWLHLGSKTTLNRVFNFIPRNDVPIVRTKLGYRNDGAYGYGYAEILSAYQEELSTIHNQRIDNSTMANIRALRVSPRAKNVDSQMQLFPGSILVGEKDEIEAIQVGDVYQSSFQNEEMTLQLVEMRAGVSPAISGAGSGSVGKTKGVYSTGGTLAAMQEGNHVTNMVTSDFRHSHQKLVSLVTSLYAKFGTGGKEKIFGEDAKYLLMALREFDEEMLRIPIRSTNASINKEVEKQTAMLLMGVMQRHYTAVAQILQQISNPMIPGFVKDYLKKVIRAEDSYMNKTLRDFGYSQPEEFIPEAETEDKNAQAQPANPMAQLSQQPGPGQNVPGQPGMGGPPGGPGQAPVPGGSQPPVQ